MTCKLCGKEITDLKSAWKGQFGWVSPYGAKAMTGAEQTGDLAHSECINLLRAKVPITQEALL